MIAINYMCSGVIIEGIWPAHSPGHKPCDFYLWGSSKDKVYKRKSPYDTNLKNWRTNIKDFPVTAATCKPEDVHTLQCMFMSTWGTFSTPPPL
jgi:hypothetical protein